MELIEDKSLNKSHKGRLFRRRLVASIASALLVIQGAVVALPQPSYAEKADISVPNWYPGSSIQVPELKPAWTAQVDNYLEMNDPYVWTQAVAEDGKVFTFADSKLVALDAKTGKKLWTYGKDLTPYVVYRDGIIYGMTGMGDQKPFAVDAKTGKVKWQSNTSTWIDTRLRTEVLVPTADTLYVIKGSITFALDKATGKLRWKADEPAAEGQGSDYFEEASGVILRTFSVQGALSSIQLNAYDKKTGKKLWGVFGQGEAVRVKDGLVYSIDYYSPRLGDYQSEPARKLTINAYNLRTGEKKGSREYSWTLTGEPPYESGSYGALMSDDKLYVEQADKIAEYDFDAYKAGAAPLRTFQRPYGDDWTMLQITQDRLFYRDTTTGELAGIKLANGQDVGWRGDAPVSQIDVYGKGMYRSQRNGTFLGINMLTTNVLFKVETGADLHGTTLKTGNMIIIQAEGRLLGVKLPAALQ
ncbi:PQQ-like beta-propeller repeat protein [Cohnella sp. LGH]|uniref:outer membrane protein assembly factor BamB family protein n=1 Tax=Cohnella sp. LGH TaxID=1619153 RepID=UPI001AD98E92|nr:PQQ-binding-like beta-propeller repeat protein [Cohnella sp. LGH]QTH41006.1 PQQ-like beta-propeller repeat protein [Cohnella sp. LGH]